LDEISLFASGTIKKENAFLLIHGMCHIRFLSRDDYLRSVFMEHFTTVSEPTLPLITDFICYENDLAVIWFVFEQVIEVLLPWS